MDTKRPNHRPNKQLTTNQELTDDFYTINEVSKILKLHHTTIMRAIKSKRLKAYRLHAKWLIKKEDIQRIGEVLNDNNNN